MFDSIRAGKRSWMNLIVTAWAITPVLGLAAEKWAMRKLVPLSDGAARAVFGAQCAPARVLWNAMGCAMSNANSTCTGNVNCGGLNCGIDCNATSGVTTNFYSTTAASITTGAACPQVSMPTCLSQGGGCNCVGAPVKKNCAGTYNPGCAPGGGGGGGG